MNIIKANKIFRKSIIKSFFEEELVKLDFKKSNINVLNYSIPINKKISQKELKRHLHTLPDKPNSVPYVTSYYKKNWGFCLAHNQLQLINDDYYEDLTENNFRDLLNNLKTNKSIKPGSQIGRQTSDPKRNN